MFYSVNKSGGQSQPESQQRNTKQNRCKDLMRCDIKVLSERVRAVHGRVKNGHSKTWYHPTCDKSHHSNSPHHCCNSREQHMSRAREGAEIL